MQFPLIASIAAAALLAQADAQQIHWQQSPHSLKFFGITYNSSSRNQGQAVAQGLGGNLATIRSQVENAWMATAFGAKWQGGPNNWGPWHGYHSIGNPSDPSSWRWASGEPATFANWAPGEPNYAHEPYGAFFTSTGYWNNLPDGIGLKSLVECNSIPRRTWSWPEPLIAAPDSIIASGDIDGNGILDIALANRSLSQILIFMGQASGSYVPSQTISYAADMLAFIDLNDDGDLDLAASRSIHAATGSVALFRYTGGTFISNSESLPLESPTCLEVCDVDNDGRDDLVATADDPSDYVRIWKQDLSGSLVLSQTLPSSGDRTYQVLSANLNGDSFPDLCVRCMWSNSLTTFTGSAAGTFTQNAVVPFASMPWDIAKWDRDGDGIDDIAVAAKDSNAVWLLSNSGSGSLTLSATLSAAVAERILCSDWDIDGRTDIAIWQRTHGIITVLYNNGQTISSAVEVAGVSGQSGFCKTRRGANTAESIIFANGTDVIEVRENPVFVGAQDTLIPAPLTTTGQPPALSAHSLAPLPHGGQLLFGGTTSSGPQPFTYVLTGTTWTTQFPLFTPVTRTGHTLLLDPVRQNNLLFGGMNPGGTALADTWTWSNNQWNLISPPTAPSARSGHRMAFDRVANLGLLFGGEGATGTALGDLWSWNGTTWAQLTPTTLPPARANHGMAYDGLRNRTVVFGGKTSSSRLADVWEWDGAAWTDVTPQSTPAWGPRARDGHAMAYDPRAERVVLQGGETAAGCQQDVWSWNGTGWTVHFAQSGPVPSARTGSQLLHDNGTNRMLLFAGGCGTSYTNDLWQLSLPTFARASSYGSACVGSNGPLALAVVNNSLPVIGQTLQLEMSGIPLYSPCIGYVGLSNETFAGVPLPFSLDFLRLYGCFAYMSADIEFPIGLPNNATNTAAWNLAIPLDPIFLSLHIYLQGLALEFGGIRRATVTNGVDARIGDR